MKADWLTEAVWEGLVAEDLPEIQARMVDLAQVQDGPREVGVISPSLVATTCPLQRMKRFLGHDPVPGMEPFMAVNGGQRDAITAVNFLRGFWGERAVLACLMAALPERLFLDMAPSCTVKAKLECGLQGMGHPDLIMRSTEDGRIGVVQIKTPSVYMLDRLQKMGESEVWNKYLPQLATELTLCRRARIPAQWGAMLFFGWEGSPAMRKPRVMAYQVEWEPVLQEFPEKVGREIQDALASGIMPEAVEPTSENLRFPCGYCPYSRLPLTKDGRKIPGCDDHAAWGIKPKLTVLQS